MNEVIQKLDDLILIHKHLTVRLKVIELEIKIIKESLPCRNTDLIEKTDKFDKGVEHKFRDKIFLERFSNNTPYQKKRLDEKIISEI